MQPYPDTPLGEFTVLYRDNTVECEHHFPSDYDGHAIANEDLKARVTISQDRVLIQIERLEPNGEMGIWYWKPVRDVAVNLSGFVNRGEDAVWYEDRAHRHRA
jgi:hypothetical protein